eukprot:CAMPEP_0175787118 /NCGR_PEP_ID=MMETSP0097-20121207/80186_1 /TAXON_ID=311494 /ORGANISM="Alexandrium monilatum, Strain CCMP3105" /LENGTH=113 /DNA_ID=CAMNT_0017098065 /DNA_START=86 /DNA_END=426 /DNA_ORIENTATION=-
MDVQHVLDLLGVSQQGLQLQLQEAATALRLQLPRALYRIVSHRHIQAAAVKPQELIAALSATAPAATDAPHPQAQALPLLAQGLLRPSVAQQRWSAPQVRKGQQCRRAVAAIP